MNKYGEIVTKPPGRPKTDWEKLFVDWLNSDLTKQEFLKSRGINYRGGAVQRNTKSWLPRICQLSLKLHAQYVGSLKAKGRPPLGVSQ